MATETVYGSGTVKGGRLKITVIPAIASLPDGPVELVVSRRKATRSAQANAYYWGVVLEALHRLTGYEPDELHDICKAKFLPKRVAFCDGNGEVVGDYVVGGTTTRLSTNEFYDYVERIRRWAADELNCPIPSPHEDAA